MKIRPSGRTIALIESGMLIAAFLFIIAFIFLE